MRRWLGLTVALVAGVGAGAQPAGSGPEQIEFFETDVDGHPIRGILA